MNLNEDKISTKLYIPSNVKTRFEFIRGFGIKELITTLFIVGVLLLVAFGIYLITKVVIVPVLIVLIGTATMVIVSAKDTNNLSVLDMINNMLDFANMQKIYDYRYFDKWRE